MNRRSALGMSITIALAGLQNAIGAPRSGSSLQLLSDDELRRILIARIDRDHQSRGIIVGIVNTAETRFIAHGNLDDVNSGVVATNSSFELGSVTKVFTALLLVDAVRRNEVALGDPAAKYLPSGLKALERNGKYITLEHLATHTSGLPSELNNLARDPSQHRSGEMTVEEANSDKPEDLYRFLSAYELTRDPGMQFEYSNLGMTLLGHILAKRAGTDYSTLLKARILRPMHLAETGGPNAHPRGVQFAVGHDAQLNAAPASHALAGAGGLRSTARDLVRFLKIAMGLSRSSFKPAFDDLLAVHRSVGPDLDQALGWQVRKFAGQNIVNKGGNTFGFCAFLGFDPAQRTGVVVLSNSMIEIADIGFHVLRPDYPLTTVHRSIPNDPMKLDGYVGVYQIEPPPTTIRISRQGNELFVDLNRSPKFRLYREADQTFFIKEIELSFEFQTNSLGHSTGLILRQRNVPDVLIPRVSESPSK